MHRPITSMITLLSRKSQGCIREIVSPYDLTVAEQPFFMAIQHHRGITQEELTTLVGVDKAATARAVKSLEQKGFLTRRQDEQDRRQNRIYPTEKTLTLGPEVRKQLLCLNNQIIEGITPEEADIVSQALIKIEQNFSKIKQSAGKEAKK